QWKHPCARRQTKVGSRGSVLARIWSIRSCHSKTVRFGTKTGWGSKLDASPSTTCANQNGTVVPKSPPERRRTRSNEKSRLRTPPALTRHYSVNRRPLPHQKLFHNFFDGKGALRRMQYTGFQLS